ncbi:hypothetical protein B0H17DRAFT_448582 [Mycena rosella]|uniref:Uncharacterized protein n=1 Tax=Mycena rosella TaxID=1033263 RepID=A0AAD7CDI3_MYCRO|nr:hypothetical protein B0H17DRAFT_448582 [Mycena rosella]
MAGLCMPRIHGLLTGLTPPRHAFLLTHEPPRFPSIFAPDLKCFGPSQTLLSRRSNPSSSSGIKSMTTGATQSQTQSQSEAQGTPPSLKARASQSDMNIVYHPSASSSAESFMTARSATTATPTPGTGTPPLTPTSPLASSEFITEIDQWMESIGGLVRALEEQHRQRRFGLSSTAGKGKSGSEREPRIAGSLGLDANPNANGTMGLRVTKPQTTK